MAGERVDERPVLVGVDTEPADKHERVAGPCELVVDAHPIAVGARHGLNIPPRMRHHARPPRAQSTKSHRLERSR